MSIQTTMHISREDAIDRIKEILHIIKDKNYQALEDATFEPKADVQTFIDQPPNVDFSNIDNWTNEMLESTIDKPFFRLSMFENYFVRNQP